MLNGLDFKSIKRGVKADWYRIPIWPHAESRKGRQRLASTRDRDWVCCRPDCRYAYILARMETGLTLVSPSAAIPGCAALSPKYLVLARSAAWSPYWNHPRKREKPLKVLPKVHTGRH
jgi:hypothetical protein